MSGKYLFISLVLGVLFSAIIAWIAAWVFANTPRVLQEDNNLATMLQEDRERRNFELGQEAYQRLDHKYGADASQ